MKTLCLTSLNVNGEANRERRMYGHGQSRKPEIFLLAANIDFGIFDDSNSEVSSCRVPCTFRSLYLASPFRKLVAK